MSNSIWHLETRERGEGEMDGIRWGEVLGEARPGQREMCESLQEPANKSCHHLLEWFVKNNCCVFQIWSPNTSRYRVREELFWQASRYPMSSRLIFTTIVFLKHGPRTRPAILSRGSCSCKPQVLCFIEMGPDHVPLSWVGQAILFGAGPFI